MTQSTKNSVTASLQFDFRGQRFSPSVDVDLDALMQKQGTINPSDLYDMLAASIAMDAYRHEYDVMLMEDIVFSRPSGLACQFVADGGLDFDAFIEAWQQQRIRRAVQCIAEKHLGIEDLTQHKHLEQALLESYRAGCKHAVQTRKKPVNSDRF